MASSSSSSSSSLSSIRTWRTAFLTLRDETLTIPTRTSLHHLLHNLIFSQSNSLISAVPNLPPHEVSSDVMFLMELTATTSDGTEDFTPILTHICQLMHSVSQHISLELNSSSWVLMLDSFAKMMDGFLGKPGNKRVFSGNAAVIKAIIQCLETLRRLISAYHRNSSISENIQLVKFLLCIVACSHGELLCSSCSSGNQRYPLEIGTKLPRYNSFWEVQTIAFTMIGEVFSRVGSFIPVDIWQSTVEVLRKVMDVLASKNLLVEDNVMSRFYVSVLNSLHLVLTNPKGSLSDHVPGFVAALRMFFVYGLSKKPQVARPIAGINVQERSSMAPKSSLADSTNSDCGPYRPPHLRKKLGTNLQQPKASDDQSLSDHESPKVEFMSSDSDFSDSDGLLKDYNSVHSSKVRVAAIVCIQDLCQADPKSFTTQWTMLLPTSEVLQPRKYEATLVTCLLFDPYRKARIASASTLAAMLDGPASVFLQVAEYKEPTKCGSFTPLSISLGQILMQLHTGILYLLQHESHSGLLASLFKILLLLITSTPYARMPADLLPTVIASLRARIEEGFPFISDQTGLLAVAISCLTVAFSTSPSSPQVKEMLLKELSTGLDEVQGKRGVLFTIFLCTERVTGPTVSFEALQALRALLHNYPSIVAACWEQVSNIIYGFLSGTLDVPKRSWKGHYGNTAGIFGEKVITAAIKVLDECLRAISGFKGTEDHLDDKFLDTPFTSDCIRTKKISSAPSYGSGSPEGTKDDLGSGWLANEQWCEAIQRHMPLILQHTSAMVRAASITCFAGITSFAFFSLTKEEQTFILSSVINAAENEVPSVRSAACRALGVIACFPQIFESAVILDKFIHAAEINTRDPLASVRITSSWALANICDSLRHCITDAPAKRCHIDSNEQSRLMALLFECALRLTKDGDKIKSNAVRALGNLSRVVQYTSLPRAYDKQVDSMALSFRNNNIEELPSSNGSESSKTFLPESQQFASLEDSKLVGRMVQAFLSCVTTGNVKVQWNVCHALSNLFLNETLRLQDMDWAPSVFSILLLLLRDSSNFKIRIQAAAALSVPSSIYDYGSSFSDVIQGLEHIVENLSSDQISAPSSFKYRVALEKQLTSTMLHVLSLASSNDHLPVKDFLVKKASFFEEWFKELCSSLGDGSVQPEGDLNSVGKQKKDMISKAIRSLINVYEGNNHHAIAQRFEKLVGSLV